MGHLGCGYWSEENGDWRTDGVVLGAIRMEQDGVAASVDCDTFHLSAFASRQDSTTPQWSTADLLTDFSIIGEVGRGESVVDNIACQKSKCEVTVVQCANDKQVHFGGYIYIYIYMRASLLLGVRILRTGRNLIAVVFPFPAASGKNAKLVKVFLLHIAGVPHTSEGGAAARHFANYRPVFAGYTSECMP